MNSHKQIISILEPPPKTKVNILKLFNIDLKNTIEKKKKIVKPVKKKFKKKPYY